MRWKQLKMALLKKHGNTRNLKLLGYLSNTGSLFYFNKAVFKQK